MTTALDAQAAAALIVAVWQGGEPLPGLPESLRPSTLSQGYAVQQALVTALGEPVVGWKLGGGSPAGKRQNGLTAPLIGQVLASRYHKSGETALRTNRRPLVVEFEIAFVLSEDVAAADLERLPDLVSAHASLELAQSRYLDRSSVSVAEIVADNAFSHSIVVGEIVDVGKIGEIVGDVSVDIDGVEMARGLIGEDLVDPQKGLQEFISYARQNNLSLRRGNAILTGTLTRPFETPDAAKLVAAQYLGKKLTLRI